MERQQEASESQSPIRKGKESQQMKSSSQARRKGMIRWHGAVSTNLLNQNILVPFEELSTDSDSGSSMTPEHKKKSLGRKMKVFLGKVITTRMKGTKSTTFLHATSSRNEPPVLSQKQHHLPKIIQHLVISQQTVKGSRRRMSQAAILQLDVREAESKQIDTDKLMRSKKTTRRVSVTSLPAGLQKTSYLPKKRQFALIKRKKKAEDKVKNPSEYTADSLQKQVDDLIETIADKSSKLLAQRHEELRVCESLGDEILLCSKQFQRVSKKNARNYKFKNVCLPCICCCY